MRSSKNNSIKRILIIALVLAAAQASFLAFNYYLKPGEESFKSLINQEVDQRQDLDPEGREMLRINLAINSYRATMGGILPASLNDLVPAFLDFVPINPKTQEPFAYKVDGQRYHLGASKDSGSPAVENKANETASAPAAADKSQEIADEPQAVYNPTGKRDPFMPFDLSPKRDNEESLTPLERLNIGQLKLTAVLKGFDEAKAIVEDQSGKGYSVKKGTKIGTGNGEVVEINDNSILILEKNIDFTGQEKTRTVEMKMNQKTGLKGVRVNPSAR